jgi:uncharacterized protein (DUF1800 family)
LYIAQLRSVAAATGSVSSGYASVLLSEDGRSAAVSISFSNLSSAQTAAYLRVGNDAVFTLPRARESESVWIFGPTGGYSVEALVDALKSGALTVRFDSARYPGGELSGRFQPAVGSQSFVAPNSPPALSFGALTALSSVEASRFLTQATFGPSDATIDELRREGINRWLDAQIALSPTSAYAAVKDDIRQFPNPQPPPVVPVIEFFRVNVHNWMAAWWKIALTSPDQLRQRMAFALSEIFVVGEGGAINDNYETKVVFYDVLVRHALGNFRDLLEEVTLSPAMGWYLSYINNMKANPMKGSAPDENYAREIQQLFTIGLVQLHPDGTLMLDTEGRPIPTFDQTTISQTAKVFTGWSWATSPATGNNTTLYIANPPPSTRLFLPEPNNGWLVPMRHYDAFHDKTEKHVVSQEQLPLVRASATVIPANQTGAQDLKMLLDILFKHPNTGPFICRQLIQRLVTSNPSSGYVYRVAQVFADDGKGVRGNLAAVARAILTDFEARSPAVLDHPGFGKIKEPILRASSILRVLRASAPNGRYLDSWFGDPRNINGFPSAVTTRSFNQAPLESPTVFNFFSPDYSAAGPTAREGLVTPEMEIIDQIFAITFPNFISSLLYRTTTPASTPPAGWAWWRLPVEAPTPSPFYDFDYTEFLAVAGDAKVLVDTADLLFCAGQMTASTRNIIVNAVESFPRATALERVQTVIQLTTASPDGALQK